MGLIDWDTFGCNFPLLGAKSYLSTSLARDEETIICEAINEKIELTVWLEHHELLHIRKGAGPSEASGKTKEKLCGNDREWYFLNILKLSYGSLIRIILDTPWSF